MIILLRGLLPHHYGFLIYVEMSAGSGIKIDGDCKVTYDLLQRDHLHRFIIYKIENCKEIVVDRIGDRSASVEDFFAALREKDEFGNDQCRYAILDYEFTIDAIGDGSSYRESILLIMYCPDTARIKNKMIYSSSFHSLKRTLVGVKRSVNINDESNLSEEYIKDIAIQFIRK